MWSKMYHDRDIFNVPKHTIFFLIIISQDQRKMFYSKHLNLYKSHYIVQVNIE